jgi:hypothetical protein
MKEVTKRRTGNIFFSYDKKEKVVRADARSSRFTDMDKLTANPDRHFKEVALGDWGVVAPRLFVNADLQPYAKVAVRVRYDMTNPETAVFSTETGGKNIVPREWSPDPKRSTETKYQYEYQIDAQLKDGAFSAAVVPRSLTRFTTEWKKSSKPFLMLSPQDWGGPSKVRLTVGPCVGFDDQDFDHALVEVMWKDGDKKLATRTFAFYGKDHIEAQMKANTPSDKMAPGFEATPIWDTMLLLSKDSQPTYTAQVLSFDKKGKRKLFKIKQGDFGADADQLQIIPPE